MTQEAAAVAVIVALMLGYYFARWRRWEGSAKSARVLADAASRAAWKARGAMLLVGSRRVRGAPRLARWPVEAPDAQPDDHAGVIPWGNWNTWAGS